MMRVSYFGRRGLRRWRTLSAVASASVVTALVVANGCSNFAGPGPDPAADGRVDGGHGLSGSGSGGSAASCNPLTSFDPNGNGPGCSKLYNCLATKCDSVMRTCFSGSYQNPSFGGGLCEGLTTCMINQGCSTSSTNSCSRNAACSACLTALVECETSNCNNSASNSCGSLGAGGSGGFGGGASGTGGIRTTGGAGGIGTTGGASGAGAKGGAGGTSSTGGFAGTAGSAGGTAGTASGAGGSSGGSAGASGASATCPTATDPNIVDAPGCFVGCDASLSSDNPKGIQGAFYGFGDGKSCTVEDPICTPANGVCMTGATVVDQTYAKWGCGIGLQLNSSGGANPTRAVYSGPAQCFNYVLSGNSGGNEVRIGFTETATVVSLISPYVSIPAFTNGHSGQICFKDVNCQSQLVCTQTVTTGCCTSITGNGTPYDLQIGVVGGNHAGNFNVCLTSLVPG
ncbi:MAG TPA: hypothetical protein VGM29_08005 [Polyangiaceae bacterium]|jgi:hypothetical protein